jgi:hypothetical protein
LSVEGNVVTGRGGIGEDGGTPSLKADPSHPSQSAFLGRTRTTSRFSFFKYYILFSDPAPSSTCEIFCRRKRANTSLFFNIKNICVPEYFTFDPTRIKITK